jgi:glycosyltransferase involved in cell wall biosynthesis
VKLAVVAPRYGPEIAGGAETAARLLATQLVARAGWQVEALTTCAADAATWANELPAGASDDGGVRVHRFPVKRGRAPDFDSCTDKIVLRGRTAGAREQQQWVEAQGPVAPGLIDAIAHTDADVVAFHPYLYHPTIAGLPRVARRALLHPAAHDEPVLRIPLFRDVFDAPAGLAYWSAPEQRLVEHRFAIASKPSAVVGLGVDPAPGDAAAARGALGLDDDPYVLCLGRVDDGKGARLLAECFASYRARRPGAPLRLVYAGPVVHAPAAHPGIVVAGRVDEATKWGLLRGALALVSPSAYESFSIVLMEAWSVGIPALVNARCEVTRDHVERSNGGFAFGSYAEFEVEIDLLSRDPALRDRLGAAGRAYVEANYRWDDVVERYSTLLSRVARVAPSQPV